MIKLSLLLMVLHVYFSLLAWHQKYVTFKRWKDWNGIQPIMIRLSLSSWSTRELSLVFTEWLRIHLRIWEFSLVWHTTYVHDVLSSTPIRRINIVLILCRSILYIPNVSRHDITTKLWQSTSLYSFETNNQASSPMHSSFHHPFHVCVREGRDIRISMSMECINALWFVLELSVCHCRRWRKMNSILTVRLSIDMATCVSCSPGFAYASTQPGSLPNVWLLQLV